MKKLIIILSILALSGCLHDVIDEPATPDDSVYYPELPDRQAFEDVEIDASRMTINLPSEPEVQRPDQVVADFFMRLMNNLELMNQEASTLAISGEWAPPLYKPSARRLIIEYPQKCTNENEDKNATLAVLWDDVNNDDLPLVGDKWYYISENCLDSANGTYVTGTKMETGMSRQLDNTDQVALEDLFENYTYQFDLQINHIGHNHAYFKDTVFTTSRQENSNDEIVAELNVNDTSRFGVKSNAAESLYLFAPTLLKASTNEDEQTLTLEYNGNYYVGDFSLNQDDNNYIYTEAGEIAVDENGDEITKEFIITNNEYLEITTTEPLVFSFDYYSPTSNLIVNPQLESGKLELVGDSGGTIQIEPKEIEVEDTIEVDGEEQTTTRTIQVIEFKVNVDGDDEIDAVSNMSLLELFQNRNFNLLNLTGG